MATTMMLARHGTKAAELPLGAIIRTAETDLRRLTCKKTAISGDSVTARTDAARRLEALGSSYAFAPKHVRKAKTAAELLLIAAQEPPEGGVFEKTKSPSRALLYSDPMRLVLAAERALGVRSKVRAEDGA